MPIVKMTTPKCMFCGKTSEIIVDMEDIARYLGGEHVQNVWPNWPADQREMLVTGTHPECWDEMVEPEPEGHDWSPEGGFPY